MRKEAQRRKKGVGFVHLPQPELVGLALPILPALTLNSVGIMSFGVARPRNASRPQPSRIARTEEKSLSTLRTTEGKKRLVFICLKAVAKRKEVRKRRRENKAMSGTV